jgi:DNA-binding LytR/AlgR family response regulator
MGFVILFVGVDIKSRSTARKFLEKNGHKIICASNAEEGASIVNKTKPDLIACEFKFTTKNYLEALQKLVNLANKKIIPFLFFTQDINQNNILAAKELGVDAIVLKPLSSKYILKKLDNLFSARSNRLKISQPSKITHASKKKEKKLKENDFVFRWINNKPTFVKIEDIKYIMAHNSCVKAFLKDGSSYQVRRTLTDVERQLPEDSFIRIHRSIIINIHFVVRVENWFHKSLQIYLKEVKDPFVISRRYGAFLKSRF